MKHFSLPILPMMLAVLLGLWTPRVEAQAYVPTFRADTSTYGLSSLIKTFDRAGRVRLPTGFTGDSFLVSNRTFNVFLAKKQAYYLSGISELSLYENFAIADVADGKLQVGANFTRKGDNKKITTLYTVAAQSNVANNIANIYSKKSFNNDIGLNLRVTRFLPGSRFLFGPQQRWVLNHKRQQRLLQTGVDSATNQDASAKLRTVSGGPFLDGRDNKLLTDANKATAQLKERVSDAARKAYAEEQTKKNVDAFYEAEQAALGKAGKGYNRLFSHWVTAQAFVPLTSRQYLLAPDTLSAFAKQQAYNWLLALGYGAFLEMKYATAFLNARYKVYYNNSVESQLPAMTKYSQYVFTRNGAKNYLSPDAETVYVGPYASYYTTTYQLQGVLMFPVSTKTDNQIGVSFLADINTGTYDAHNYTVGVPFFFKGKDKGVNVEIQLKWTDWNNTVNPAKSRGEKFVGGLSVSLPFGSIAK